MAPSPKSTRFPPLKLRTSVHTLTMGLDDVRNGLLLRADLHRLFDTGYITATPDLRLEVGARLRDEYHNGRSYYPLHGARLQVPPAVPHRPEKEFLESHNEHVFRG